MFHPAFAQIDPMQGSRGTIELANGATLRMLAPAMPRMTATPTAQFAAGTEAALLPWSLSPPPAPKAPLPPPMSPLQLETTPQQSQHIGSEPSGPHALPECSGLQAPLDPPLPKNTNPKAGVKPTIDECLGDILSSMSQKEEGAKAKAKARAKDKAKSKAKTKATAETTKAKTQANARERPSAKKHIILFGCGKCRGSHSGCLQCRRNDFQGRRWQR